MPDPMSPEEQTEFLSLVEAASGLPPSAAQSAAPITPLQPGVAHPSVEDQAAAAPTHQSAILKGTPIMENEAQPETVAAAAAQAGTDTPQTVAQAVDQAAQTATPTDEQAPVTHAALTAILDGFMQKLEARLNPLAGIAPAAPTGTVTTPSLAAAAPEPVVVGYAKSSTEDMSGLLQKKAEISVLDGMLTQKHAEANVLDRRIAEAQARLDAITAKAQEVGALPLPNTLKQKSATAPRNGSWVDAVTPDPAPAAGNGHAVSDALSAYESRLGN